MLLATLMNWGFRLRCKSIWYRWPGITWRAVRLPKLHRLPPMSRSPNRVLGFLRRRDRGVFFGGLRGLVLGGVFLEGCLATGGAEIEGFTGVVGGEGGGGNVH